MSGDLLTALPMLAAEAPANATLVVFHTAVLAYVADPGARAAFARTVGDLNAVWISNEAPSVFPEIAAKLSAAARKALSCWRSMAAHGLDRPAWRLDRVDRVSGSSGDITRRGCEVRPMPGENA